MSLFLVWSNEHHCWWGPNKSGYTDDVWQAGRYQQAAAQDVCRTRTWQQGRTPPEVMVLAPENNIVDGFTPADLAVIPALMRRRIGEATQTALRTATTEAVASRG